MSLIDTLRGGSNKARARSLAVALALAAPCVASAEVFEGLQLPEGSRKVAEHRYHAPSGYEETAKYYKSVYPPAQYARRGIANQPGIKAFHIAIAGRGVQGLNIYEANDETRIFIIPETEVAKPARRSTESRPTGKKTGAGKKQRR